MLWLQLHLCKRKGTLVVVSHDQEFLNVVCNNIIHVHNRKLAMYVLSACLSLCVYMHVHTQHVISPNPALLFTHRLRYRGSIDSFRHQVDTALESTRLL